MICYQKYTTSVSFNLISLFACLRSTKYNNQVQFYSFLRQVKNKVLLYSKLYKISLQYSVHDSYCL